MRAKRTMKERFGRPHVKKNGEEGKLIAVPDILELHSDPKWREVRCAGPARPPRCSRSRPRPLCALTGGGPDRSGSTTLPRMPRSRGTCARRWKPGSGSGRGARVKAAASFPCTISTRSTWCRSERWVTLQRLARACVRPRH